MTWHVQHMSDGRFAVSSNAKRANGAREDHPLYVICVAEIEFDAHRIARLLNDDEEARQADGFTT